MKKILGIVALLFGAVAVASAEVKVDMLTWFDYTVDAVSNGTQTGGQFNISRAYLTLQGDLGKDALGGKIKGRVTLDFAKLQFNQSVVTSVGTNGSGTNKTSTLASIPVKYAYVDYDVLGLKALVFTAGVMKTTFGNIAYWEYPMPVKDITEAYKNVKCSPSADFGIGLSGSLLPIEGLTKNLFQYNLQLVNGDSYEKFFSISSSDPNIFGGQGSIYILPFDGTRIGFSYRYNETKNNATNWKYENAWALMASANNLTIGDIKLPLDFLFQMTGLNTLNTYPSTNKSVNGGVISASLGYSFLDGLITPYVRFDSVNEDASQTNTSSKLYQYNWIYAGINSRLSKGYDIKAFYGYKLEDHEMQALLQFEGKLSFEIWQ